MKVHMLSETVAFRPYDFLIDVSSGPWDYGLPGSARCIDCFPITPLTTINAR